MTLLVRDEADILDWNLRYHLSRGVSHFVVTDNLSIDETPAILADYERRGLVTLIREPSDDYSQHAWVTRMLEIAQTELQPDWILHSDADEFWWPNRCADLKSAFSRARPEHLAVTIDRQNFLGPPEASHEPFFSRMIYRQVDSVNYFGNPLPGKVAHRPMENAAVDQGNHTISNFGRRIPAPHFAEVSILHFPSRSMDQLRHKIEVGGAAYERNAVLPPNVGGAWRVLHEELRHGRFEKAAEKCFVREPAVAAESGNLEKDRRLLDFLSNL